MQAYVIRVFTDTRYVWKPSCVHDESENSGREFIHASSSKIRVYTESSRTANQLPRFLEITESYYFTYPLFSIVVERQHREFAWNFR